MVAVKTQDIDRLIAQPPADAAFFLVFGEDAGLVAERAKSLVHKLSGGGDDPFALVKLDAQSVTSDSSRLADEAYTVSLFGGRRTIWIRDAGGRYNIAPQLTPLFKNPPQDTVIVVDAGDLKKTAPIRGLFEKDPRARAIPCYADDDRSLTALIDAEVKAAGLTITHDARRMLLHMLGGDRLASRGEITKLTLYARGLGKIDVADVEAVVGEAAAFGLDEVSDAVATGHLAQLGDALSRAKAADVAQTAILNAVIRHFQTLDSARLIVENGVAPGVVVEGMRPPVFFKRKEAMGKALSMWTSSKLARALTRLGDAQFKARQINGLEEAIVADVLFTLARFAASKG